MNTSNVVVLSVSVLNVAVDVEVDVFFTSWLIIILSLAASVTSLIHESPESMAKVSCVLSATKFVWADKEVVLP